jgi:hypothetical protein
MSVHQTREYFKEKYGFIVDNKEVGPTLASSYWECGNSENFLDIVKKLTGKELSGSAWINALEIDTETLISNERKEYEEMIQRCANETANNDEIDLAMNVRFVDGDTLIADSTSTSLLEACNKFEKFVLARVAKGH